MSIRPKVSQRYRTASGEIAAITEDLGKGGLSGFVGSGSRIHNTVWNNEGENQEYIEYDLVEELSSAPTTKERI